MQSRLSQWLDLVPDTILFVAAVVATAAGLGLGVFIVLAIVHALKP